MSGPLAVRYGSSGRDVKMVMAVVVVVVLLKVVLRRTGGPEVGVPGVVKKEESLPSPAHKAHLLLSNHRDAVPERRLLGIGYG